MKSCTIHAGESFGRGHPLFHPDPCFFPSFALTDYFYNIENDFLFGFLLTLLMLLGFVKGSTVKCKLKLSLAMKTYWGVDI
jgi:hypothetical protein